MRVSAHLNNMVATRIFLVLSCFTMNIRRALNNLPLKHWILVPDCGEVWAVEVKYIKEEVSGSRASELNSQQGQPGVIEIPSRVMGEDIIINIYI